MELKKIIWKKSIALYTSGENAFIGRIHVGSILYNGIDRDDAKRHIATCRLPGLKNSTLGKFPTEDIAKARVETAITTWLAEIIEPAKVQHKETIGNGENIINDVNEIVNPKVADVRTSYQDMIIEVRKLIKGYIS